MFFNSKLTLLLLISSAFTSAETSNFKDASSTASASSAIATDEQMTKIISETNEIVTKIKASMAKSRKRYATLKTTITAKEAIVLNGADWVEYKTLVFKRNHARRKLIDGLTGMADFKPFTTKKGITTFIASRTKVYNGKPINALPRTPAKKPKTSADYDE